MFTEDRAIVLQDEVSSMDTRAVIVTQQRVLLNDTELYP